MACFRGTFPIVIASNRRSLCCHTTEKIVATIKMFSSWMIGECCYLEMVFMLIKYAGMYDIVYVCWRHGNLMAKSWDEYRIGVLMNKGSICTISLFTIFSTQSITLMPIPRLWVQHFESICRSFLKINHLVSQRRIQGIHNNILKNTWQLGEEFE